MKLQLQRMFYQHKNCLIEDMFSFYQGHIQNLLRSVGIQCHKSHAAKAKYLLFGIPDYLVYFDENQTKYIEDHLDLNFSLTFLKRETKP